MHKPRLMFLCILLAVLVHFVSVVAVCARTDVIYPAPESTTDVRFNDLVAILQAALEKTTAEYGPFTMSPAPKVMNESRQIMSLQQGNMINVLWSSTSEAKEAEMMPIRIPLRMGLLGYRISIINRQRQGFLNSIRTLDDLKRVQIGQGIGWGDIAIYQAAGIDVLATGYGNLFGMINKGRLDMFPRGISEAFWEYDANKAVYPEIAVEQHLVLYYPWPYYFFFNRHDVALAERIEKGLRMMLKDGSFKAIFDRYNAETIARAGLKHRTIIRIPNSFLPKATPLGDLKLWYIP